MKKLLLLTIIAFNSILLFANENNNNVVVGMYLNRITELNLKEGYFNADFYIWFRWKNQNLSPYETFGLANGTINNKVQVDIKDLGNDEKYACLRIDAKIYKNWEVKKFPFDIQNLEIKIEDEQYVINLLNYLPDTANSKLSNNNIVGSYELSDFRIKKLDNRYYTNYGDTTLKTNSESIYSQLIFLISTKERSLTVLIKTYWGLFISVLVGLIAFLVKPENIDSRIGVIVGALFAAAAANITLFSDLPQTAFFTLPDALGMLTLMYLFCILFYSAIAFKIYSDKADLIDKIDKLSIVISPILYFISVGYFYLYL